MEASLSIRSTYSRRLCTPDEILESAEHALKDVDFDTLVATGTSGLLILPLLARHLNVHYLAIRKPNDGSHSCQLPEGDLGGRWIFVDDFISSGRTFMRCYYAVADVAERHSFSTKFCGVYSYQSYGIYAPEAYQAPQHKEIAGIINAWEPDPYRTGDVRRRPSSSWF